MGVEFVTDQLVLAHVKGHPAWPARVTHAIENGSNKKISIVYRVIFYGTDEEAILPATDLLKYDRSSEILKLVKPKRIRLFNTAIFQIEEEYRKRESSVSTMSQENIDSVPDIIEPQETFTGESANEAAPTGEDSNHMPNTSSDSPTPTTEPSVQAEEESPQRNPRGVWKIVTDFRPARKVPPRESFYPPDNSSKENLEKWRQNESRLKAMKEKYRLEEEENAKEATIRIRSLLELQLNLMKALRIGNINEDEAVRLLRELEKKSCWYHILWMLGAPSFVLTLEKVSRLKSFPKVAKLANEMLNTVGVNFVQAKDIDLEEDISTHGSRRLWMSRFLEAFKKAREEGRFHPFYEDVRDKYGIVTFPFLRTTEEPDKEPSVDPNSPGSTDGEPPVKTMKVNIA